MNTQIVQHKSRDFDVVLKFTATENTLSWAFKQEGDGEVYDIGLDNVASYQIAGAPVSIPYPVSNGVKYSVTIVKQTNGQPATISFNTRRAVNKTVQISVPDFGIRRYIYMIDVAGNLIKIDTQLTVASNYIGAGAWTVPPVVNTYQLPVIAGMVWHCCQPYKLAGVEKVIIIGRELTGNTRAAYAIFDVQSATFEDLNGGQTYLTGAAGSGINYFSSPIYDYVNNVVAFVSNLASNKRASLIDLNIKSLLSSLITDDLFDYYYSDTRCSNTYMEPSTGKLVSKLTSFLNQIPATSFYYQPFGSDYARIFDRSTGLIYRHNQGTGILGYRTFFPSGGIAGSFRPATVSGTPNAVMIDTAQGRVLFAASYTDTGIGFIKMSDLSYVYSLTNPVKEAATARYNCIEGINGQGFAISNDGTTGGDILTGRSNKRLYILEPNFTGNTINYRYLDFSNPLVMFRGDGIND